MRKYSYHVDGNCNVGVDKFTYNLDMRLESPHEDVADDALINADISNMTHLQRIERLRKIFYTFRASLFFRNLSSAADVRPSSSPTS